MYCNINSLHEISIYISNYRLLKPHKPQSSHHIKKTTENYTYYMVHRWNKKSQTEPSFAPSAHCRARRDNHFAFASCAHCRAIKWQHRNGGFLFSRLLFLFALCLDWSSSRRRFIWIWYWPVYGRTRFEQETTSNSSNKVTAELDLPERVVYVAPDIWCRRLLHYWQWQTSSSIRETGSWEQIILLTWIPYQMRPRKSRFQ